MKGIENIENKIIADGALKAETILAEARASAEKIIEKAEGERSALLDGAKIARAEADNASKDRDERAAVLSGRKQTLAAKQEMISRAYEGALDRLLNLPQAEYCDLLAKLAANASSTEAGELVFNEKDKAAVGEIVLQKAIEKSKGKLTLSQDTTSIRGGFILRMKNSEINCAIEAIVREAAEKNSIETAGILF